MEINAVEIQQLLAQMEAHDKLSIAEQMKSDLDTNKIVRRLHELGIKCRRERVNDHTVTVDWRDEFGVFKSYDLRTYG